MKIAHVNIIFSLQIVGGFSLYWSELIKGLTMKGASPHLFGTPLIEAMRAWCAVISVNVSSIPEVYKGTCVLIDTRNSPDLIDKNKFLENLEARKEVIQKGIAKSQHYIWNECFKGDSSILQRY
jgi:glycosyltransferase involved in cell wall biosynthesis